MQKLNNHGSVLVGVVAFTAILAIVVLSTIGLVRNMQNNEDAAFNEAKLSGAVESGLILGAALVNKQNSFATPNNDLFESAPVSVNEIVVTVRSAPSGTDTALITATATKVGGAYSKTISMRLVKGATSVTKDIFNTHGLYSGDVLTISGSSNLVVWNPLTHAPLSIYGQSSIGKNGNPAVIGSLISQGSISANTTLGTVTPNATTGTGFPDINMTSFIQSAVLTVTNAALIPNNFTGNVYIDADNVTLSNKTIVGMVVVRGNVSISSTTISNSGGFAVMSVTGNIKLTGNTNIVGSLYSKSGDIELTGNNQTTGTAFAKGNLDLGGNPAFTYASLSKKTLDGITLTGSNGSPTIVSNSWNEENK